MITIDQQIADAMQRIGEKIDNAVAHDCYMSNREIEILDAVSNSINETAPWSTFMYYCLRGEL